ncbi:AMP-binding protein, partial [Pseudomonas syringae pv. tagetis]|uniref:AMP-binding protein n=1 Tax=Pseudomonas syringae group genomosp. 7 TaxID=251699 RepID=UPI00376F758E
MNLALATAQTVIVKPHFSVDEIIEIVEKEQVTMMSLVPTLYIRLANHPNLSEYNLQSLKVIISGGASLPIEIQEQFGRITGSDITT